MTLNFSDKPQFTLKEIIYVVAAVIAFGGTQAVDTYNDNIFKSQMREFITAQKLDNKYTWGVLNDLRDEKKIDELSLRKLELDVTRIITELKK